MLINLDKARHAALHLGRDLPTDKLLWKGTYHKDYTKSTRNFLSMTMHDAYQVGSRWEDKPGYKQRETCARCTSSSSNINCFRVIGMYRHAMTHFN
ncbi:uncharacterized protein BT62DRAFT_306137 [Guyanagaster necrorhizus]|uniref:Uncharacterized protein n=1 Tax=Guyanagaster necrorhizus TaxID=856835 RepID=A0A9P7VNM9_9AGAR|nr:uncharacterized protein BT62DRAFT_306137 [Guyanagaster necrorhizus MCA 3950]KAG7443957.1 hypothetical protein BT62DRAFT_306137 [Guyanagaster necrorhizus MCA 3950]